MARSEDEHNDRVIDGTSPMERIVQATIDIAVVLVFGLLRAIFESIRAALFGERTPEPHPEPDADGTYRAGRQVPVGKSRPDGGDADTT